MKEFFTSPIGKVLALSAVIYAWKFVSVPVAVLLLVAFLRSGAIREYLEGETGMTPPGTTDYVCPSEFVYDADKKMCAKGTETRTPSCTDPTMTWNTTDGKCMVKPVESPSPSPPPSSTSSGGPPGGSTPGAMAAQNAMANAMPPLPPPVTESFTPYGGKKNDFASL